MVDGSCHGVRKTKEGPGLQDQNGVEMCMGHPPSLPSGPRTIRNGWRWDKCELKIIKNNKPKPLIGAVVTHLVDRQGEGCQLSGAQEGPPKIRVPLIA